jgi:hypothetical protein
VAINDDPFNLGAEQLKWRSLAVPDLNPVFDVATSVATFLETVRASLELAKVALQGYALLITNIEDLRVQALNQAIRSAIAAITGILDQLLGSSAVYLLPVSIPKKGLYQLGRIINNSSNEGSNIIEFPANSVTARGTPAENAALKKSAIWTQLLNPTDLFTGGNAYFVKSVSESLFDPEDQNRPKFETNHNWAYATGVIGASDVTSIIQLLGFLQSLVDGGRGGVGISGDVGDLVPTGVRVRPSGRQGAVIVEWDLVPLLKRLDSYDQSTIEPLTYAIIRSTSLESRTARRVLDLFPTKDITEGMTGIYGAEVLAVKTYDGVVTQYLDTSTHEVGVTYYYHVAFSTQIRPPSEGARESFIQTLHGRSREAAQLAQAPTVLGYDALSSPGVYRKTARNVEDWVGSGKDPTWIKTPSIGGIIPPLGNFIDLIEAYLGKFTSTLGNITQGNTELINLLNREIARYAALATTIQQRVRQIASVFATPNAGIYCTVRFGNGNATSFLANLVGAFDELEDPKRPPFDTGDEFVAGFVLLAAGPSLAPIEAAYNLFKALFDPDNTVNPILEGIQSVNTELRTLEASLLLDIEGGTLKGDVDLITFNEDMTTRKTGEGDSTCDP